MEGNANLLIVGHFLEALQEFLTAREALEVVVRHLVLGLHPRGCFFGGIVLQPAVRVRNLCAEICVYSVVFARYHRLGRAGVKCNCCHQE